MASGDGVEEHWDAAYRTRGVDGVSWFQPEATVSLGILEELAVPTHVALLDVGGGASHLADALVERGYTDVTVLDVSAAALADVRRRLPPGAPVTLVHADVVTWRPTRRYALWHDRALLHFFVEERDRAAYLERLHEAVEDGGLVVLGTFAPDGPDRCSGLPVVRYAPEALAALLGPSFEILLVRGEDHRTPRGAVQPFVWVAGRVGAG